MAASKLHLKNVDKSYKLKATDQKTNEGRTIYKNTKTGELHSELSMTLEVPEGSGNWINVPSLINGRVYNVQGVLDMLKAGNIKPNSTGHASEFEAVEAAKFHSNNLQNSIGVTLNQNKPGSRAGSSANLSMEKNPDKHHVSRDRNKIKELAAIMDRANAEKEDEFYDPTKPRTNIWGDNNPRYWDGWFKGVGGLKAVQNAYEQPPLSAQDQAIFDQARKQRLLDDEKKTIGIPGYGATNQGTVSAADQTMFDNAKEKRRLLHMGKAMSAYGPRPTPDKKIVPEYIDVPKNTQIADYGKMPGFKFKSAGYKKPDGEEAGYWSADETSDFWQTDAGYEKAMQTWGEKPGWVKPGYRPKKKELDIEAIKKWFTPSK